MKPVDIKGNKCIDSLKEVNDKDLKFKVGDMWEYRKKKHFY